MAAILSLPRTFRKDPGEEALHARKGRVTVTVNYKDPHCGPNSGHYVSPPKTSYQAACRKKPTTDIQHYTRVFNASMISRYAYAGLWGFSTYLTCSHRIANVPLTARADYRCTLLV